MPLILKDFQILGKHRDMKPLSDQGRCSIYLCTGKLFALYTGLPVCHVSYCEKNLSKSDTN